MQKMFPKMHPPPLCWVCFCPCDVSFTRLLSQKLHFSTFPQIPFFLTPTKTPRISSFSASSEALHQSQPPWPQGPDSWKITLSRCRELFGDTSSTLHILCILFLLLLWDFPGKSTEVGCHFLLQRIFWTPKDWTWVSHIVSRCFTIWAREVLLLHQLHLKSSGVRFQRLQTLVLRALPSCPHHLQIMTLFMFHLPILRRSILYWNSEFIPQGQPLDHFCSLQVSWSHVFFIWMSQAPAWLHITADHQVLVAKVSIVSWMNLSRHRQYV